MQHLCVLASLCPYKICFDFLCKMLFFSISGANIEAVTFNITIAFPYIVYVFKYRQNFMCKLIFLPHFLLNFIIHKITP